MMEPEETTEQDAPADWYPDPSQPNTIRFWDGQRWTDQRAPAPKDEPPTRAIEGITPRLGLGVLGSIVAIAGCFLPRADSESLLHIANNTLIQGGDGVIVILLALAGLGAAFASRELQETDWRLFVIGALLIAAAIYLGTGERIALENGLGEDVPGTAGVGIWAVGVGGVLLAIAGRGSKASHPSA